MFVVIGSLAGMAGLFIPTCMLINWRCPRCGALFQYQSPYGMAAKRCGTCGLHKFDDGARHGLSG